MENNGNKKVTKKRNVIKLHTDKACTIQLIFKQFLPEDVYEEIVLDNLDKDQVERFELGETNFICLTPDQESILIDLINEHLVNKNAKGTYPRHINAVLSDCGSSRILITFKDENGNDIRDKESIFKFFGRVSNKLAEQIYFEMLFNDLWRHAYVESDCNLPYSEERCGIVFKLAVGEGGVLQSQNELNYFLYGPIGEDDDGERFSFLGRIFGAGKFINIMERVSPQEFQGGNPLDYFDSDDYAYNNTEEEEMVCSYLTAYDVFAQMSKHFGETEDLLQLGYNDIGMLRAYDYGYFSNDSTVGGTEVTRKTQSADALDSEKLSSSTAVQTNFDITETVFENKLFNDDIRNELIDSGYIQENDYSFTNVYLHAIAGFLSTRKNVMSTANNTFWDDVLEFEKDFVTEVENIKDVYEL